ncbi:BnaC01g38910D [Brassica napus]|uniref:BnaC01g38910D protein n=1 Tax=Brassica napus TaxID=3708 RepID=A0A078G6X3_BRANA|nr:BnaC01g38910D [Brassica napus]
MIRTDRFSCSQAQAALLSRLPTLEDITKTIGLSEVEIDAITETCGIPAGTFPIRYLGLPLNTRKLSIANCEPLLHQIKSKIKSWTSKYLSFAGRQVLISTVIGGITNFWSGAFILPKECISLIDKMCNAFLWKGTLEGKYVARVAWEKVATPRKNGGLATVYEVWWERNERLHRGKFRSVDMVVKKINGLIKNKISSLRPESNRRASSLMQIWFSIIDGSS